MGTPRFGAIILQIMINNGYLPCLVVTGPDKKIGRQQLLTPSAVKLIAQKNCLLIKETDKIIELKPLIGQIKPDLVISAAFGLFLPGEILSLAKKRFLNIHPSLLPRLRGPSPIQFAILNGDSQTGTTIIEMTGRLDAGPIVAQERINLSGQAPYYEELHDCLADLSGRLLIKVLPAWLNGKIKSLPQEEAKATYTRLLTRQDGKIDWQKDAGFLERQVRAFHAWPNSYFIWPLNNKPLEIKLLKARYLAYTDKKHSPGQVFLLPDKQLAVRCGRGTLVIEKLQPAGKKEMSAPEFLRGHYKFINSVLK